MVSDVPPVVPAASPAISLPTRTESADHVRASLVLSFAERYLGALIQLVETAILARLLTPHDYGIYTVAIVLVGVTSVLQDFGTVSFLFQERNLSSHGIQTVHGVSLLFSGVIAVTLAALSGQIARFYDAPGVRDVLLVLSVTLMLTPYSSVVMTLLRREMNFRAVLLIEVTAALANGAVAIGFALAIGGFMSLAWGTLAGAVTTCLVAATRQPPQYRLRPSLREWRRVMAFGAVSTAGILLREIGARSPELVAGRLLGMEAVGLLTRADGLVAAFERFIRGAVTPVVVSSFAAQNRRGESIKENFCHAMQMWTGVAWPFFAVLCFLASPTIHILFGAGWDKAIPILRLYCVAAGISALTSLNWNAFQAIGAVTNLLKIQIVIQPLKIALVVVASFFNLLAVAAALIAAALVSVAIAYDHSNRLFQTSLTDALRASLKSIGVTACAIAAPLLAMVAFGTASDHVWLTFMVGGMGAGIGWCLGLRLFRHALWPEIVFAWEGLYTRLARLPPGRGA